MKGIVENNKQTTNSIPALKKDNKSCVISHLPSMPSPKLYLLLSLNTVSGDQPFSGSCPLMVPDYSDLRLNASFPFPQA